MFYKTVIVTVITITVPKLTASLQLRYGVRHNYDSLHLSSANWKILYAKEAITLLYHTVQLGSFRRTSLSVNQYTNLQDVT